MDQKKTGSFLRELRKEHGITQEQFAEKLGVSARTISRWETGSNMPDIADYYDVGIPEIIAGERKSDGMNEEVKEVADAMSDYAGEEKAKLVKSIRNISIIGLIALIIYMVLGETGAYERNTLFRYAYGYSEVLIYVTVVMFPLYTTGLLSKLRIRITEQASDKEYRLGPYPGTGVKSNGLYRSICCCSFDKDRVIEDFLNNWKLKN